MPLQTLAKIQNTFGICERSKGRDPEQIWVTGGADD
jgi:hypothetical protein